jgi:hypothetical protein
MAIRRIPQGATRPAPRQQGSKMIVILEQLGLVKGWQTLKNSMESPLMRLAPQRLGEKRDCTSKAGTKVLRKIRPSGTGKR